MEQLDVIQRLAVWAMPVLLAITVHEVAHGWMALRLGDRTALMLGRLTLNPIKHIDPIGTLLVPAVMLALGGFVFGWAKPVPVTWENLRKPRRDMALVALAGPMANLLMAVLWLLALKLGIWLQPSSPWFGTPLLYMSVAGIVINCVLMVLNLLPLPPLDGGRVVAGLLPGPLSWRYGRIEPYGLIIVLLLFVTNILGKILSPVVGAVLWLLLGAAQVSPGYLQSLP
jgi:Zn-dependent protease